MHSTTPPHLHLMVAAHLPGGWLLIAQPDPHFPGQTSPLQRALRAADIPITRDNP